MANSYKALRQWSLKSDADSIDYESWKNNLLFSLGVDDVYKPFLKEGVTWGKLTKSSPNRGFTDDPETATAGLSASQKASALNLMLGQIANFAPIYRASIVKNTTCLNDVWREIRQHLGFQANGGRVLDLADMKLKPDERPEDLYQRLLAFMDDNLMKSDGGVKHHDVAIAEDEEASPSLENYTVVLWLKMIHKDLPMLVKQRYGTELRTNSIASIKWEISAALDSLLAEIGANQDSKVLRSVVHNNNFRKSERSGKPINSYSSSRECPLCKQAGRSDTDHFLTKCKYLPERERRFLTKTRTVNVESGEESTYEDEDYDGEITSNHRRVAVEETAEQHQEALMQNDVTPIARRVPVIPSPYLDCFYKHYSVRVTVDSGATGNMIRFDVVKRLNLNIRKNTQKSNQADGHSHLDIVGEVTIEFQFKEHRLILEALVAAKLDDEVLGGIPFMKKNDVWVRPRKNLLGIGDATYTYKDQVSSTSRVRRVQPTLVRSPANMTVWPGGYVELQVPETFAGKEIGIEPRIDSMVNSNQTSSSVLWPSPQVLTCSDTTIRIPNLSANPLSIRKDDHLCQIVRTVTVEQSDYIKNNQEIASPKPPPMIHENHLAYKDIIIDPDNITPPEYKDRLESICDSYNHVFRSKIGGYNGRDGAVKAVVNMGPVLPPQRKGRVPMYNKDKLNLLQSKFDELEELGVFAKPEDVNVIVEYLNPSMLIKKPRGGHRLVTEFGEIARYAKPQPSLLTDMNSVLRWLAQWKYIICTDLQKAYYQIPLDPASMKYCGVCTPFKGTRVYTTAAMGMPGSETALEEVVSRVFGSLIHTDRAIKIADNLFTGGNSLDELCNNWEEVLKAASRNNLNFSPGQTIINPKSTTILGWVWSQGTLSATPHSICTLQSCETPKTVKELKSFIGAYKVLSRVIPECASVISPLDNVVAGRASSDKIVWSDEMDINFRKAKSHLQKATTIKMPCRSDKLWIVLDAATRSPGIGATLYVGDDKNNLKIGGFFSAKLKGSQIDWLPCEREALGIAGAVKYFQPYITQSELQTTILTDNKPCVQAYAKAQKGEFSASPRVSTFLSICHRFQVSVRHIAGAQNLLSDHQSRNPVSCEDSCCQICRFLTEIEESVVRSVSVQDVLSGNSRLPFTTRSAWKATQLECPDLRRTHAHLSQGTRPSRKQTKIRDIKRYLQRVMIAKDGLLIVRNDDVNSTVSERIVVPRSIFNGLLVSLHLKLDHPTMHQLKLVVRRYFFALDMDSLIDEVSHSCHTCAALQEVSHTLEKQSTSDPPDGVCTQFAADVIRREKQFIFLLREVVTSYTWSMLINNEQADSLRLALLKLCIPIRPIDGPCSVVRVDPAPGFRSLDNDACLKSHNIILDLGRIKNVNKNPVAERGVEELEVELLKQNPSGGTLTDLSLATATARLNARIRTRGLSAREMLFQRDQFTNNQIPVVDMDLISDQHQAKLRNHQFSERSKAPGRDVHPDVHVDVGDLIYLHNDASKLKSRDRYIVASRDNDWVYIRKFAGQQLRSNSYKVKRSECYKVPPTVTKQPMGGSASLQHHATEDSIYRPSLSIDSGQDIAGDQAQDETVGMVSSSIDLDGLPPEQLSTAVDVPTVNLEDPIPEVIVPPQQSCQMESLPRSERRTVRNCSPIDRLEVKWSSKSYTNN